MTYIVAATLAQEKYPHLSKLMSLFKITVS